MLKFKEFDLLNENMNKARSVLRQAGVDETDPNFLKLRELLKNNLGYTGKFTEWMFLQKIDFNRLENLYNRIKSITVLIRDQMSDFYFLYKIFYLKYLKP